MAPGFFIIALSLCAAAGGDNALIISDLRLMPHGLSKSALAGVRRLTLNNQPPKGVRPPAESKVSSWTVLPFGPPEQSRQYVIALAESDGATPAVWFDANADRDLTNDPPVDVDLRSGADGKPVSYGGAFALSHPLFGELPLRIQFHRFLPAPAQRRRLPANEFYCTADYGLAGELQINGRRLAIAIMDGGVTGNFAFAPGRERTGELSLFVDLNHNGVFDAKTERFNARDTIAVAKEAFVIEQVSANGRDVRLARTKATAPRIRHNSTASLAAGGAAPAFTEQTIGGRSIRFPHDYKGRIVLVEFWATWCAPCRAEIPHLRRAYERFHDQGFEILGVCTNRTRDGPQVRRFVKDQKLPWPQIHPHGAAGGLYRVARIPRGFLVDGDTGKIIASLQELRGGKLEGVVEAALREKFGK
ncbi:MAG: TlpA disulfide reductase family protein [Phycisphaerae bacterium]